MPRQSTSPRSWATGAPDAVSQGGSQETTQCRQTASPRNSTGLMGTDSDAALESASKLYDESMTRFVASSSDADLQTLLDIFALVLVARQPLPLATLVRALNEPGSQPGLRPRATANPRIRSEYVQIHILDRVLPFFEQGTGVIRFSQPSVHDYLQESAYMRVSSDDLSVRERAELLMTGKCLRHLRTLPDVCEDTTNLPPEYAPDQFTQYAVVYWMSHFHDAQRGTDDNFVIVANAVFGRLHGIELKKHWSILYEEATGEQLPIRVVSDPFFAAAYFGLHPLITMALRRGVAIDAPDAMGKTALLWAVERGHAPIVESLLQKGARTDACTRSGWSCLHFAAYQGHGEILQQLVDHGANIHSIAADGKTPLDLAIEAGKVESVARLLDAGADAQKVLRH